MLRWIGDSLRVPLLAWRAATGTLGRGAVLHCRSRRRADAVGHRASPNSSCTTARSTSAAAHRSDASSWPFKSRSGNSPGCGLRSVEASGEPSPNGSRSVVRYPVVRTPHPWE